MTFRDEVETPAWLAEVTAWVHAQVAERGWAVTGPADQRRVRPWSTQVVVPTDRGPVWFKASSPLLGHEAGVHAVLARLLPDLVDEPLAVDPARGWLLTADHGPTLHERDGLGERDQIAVVDLVGGLQRRLVGHEADLLAAGLPDCRPVTVPARFDLLVEELGRLPRDHPSHLPDEERAALRARREVVVAAAERLDGGPLPCSFQHGDAHPGNVVARAGGVRLVDFGDAQWAHVLETLAVPWGVGRHHGLAWPPVQAAYDAHWADLASPADRRALLVDAMVTQGVNRAHLWWTALDGARPPELAEWGDGPAQSLRLALEPFEP